MRVSVRLVAALVLSLSFAAVPGVLCAAFAVDARLLDLRLELETLRGFEQQLAAARTRAREDYGRLLAQFNAHGCGNISGAFVPGGTCSQLQRQMEAVNYAHIEVTVALIAVKQNLIPQLEGDYRTELGTYMATLAILSPPPRPTATTGVPGTPPPEAQRRPPSRGADRGPAVRGGTRVVRSSPPPRAVVRGPVRGHDRANSAYARAGQAIGSQLQRAIGGTRLGVPK